MFVSSTLGKSLCIVFNKIKITIMCKTSKTISVIIRNHQYVDGQSYRLTQFGECNLRYISCDGPMGQSHTIDYRSFTATSLVDCISTSNREALENLHMSLSEQEETNSVPSSTLQVTDACVETETVETKSKRRTWKWLAGIAAGTGLAGVIAYVFKNN